VGLIICNPFGYEAICSHRATRLLAESTAGAGIPTLRFEYSGTGNSMDIAQEDDQLLVWTQDVASAANELRRLAGVEHICLLGFRLGAALAVLAAQNPDASIDAIVAVAPVVSGRKYLRELRTTRLAGMLGAESSDRPPDAGENSEAETNSLEISGFQLSATTVAALPQLDLSEHVPPMNLLVIDDVSLPTSSSWADLALSRGAAAQYERIPGVLSILKTAPQFSETPAILLETISHWLAENFNVPPLTSNPGLAQDQVPAQSIEPQLVLNYRNTAGNSCITEQAVFFGVHSRLFGIVTTPAASEKRRRAVVLLNAGADHHIGPNRMYVALARRWARRGYTVLRMDFAGIGDSGTRPGRPINEVFPPAALEDIGDAIAFVRTRYGIADVTLVGLCSGAYHALRAAVASLPASRVLLINPQNYFWKEGMTVNDMQLGELVRNPSLYRSRAFSIESWKRLFTGKIDVFYIAKILGNSFFLAIESGLREVARRLRIRIPNDLGWELQAVTARGVRVIFVFARDEPGIKLLKIQAGSFVARVGDRCRIHILEGGDHVFSKPGPRSRMEDILDSELFAAFD
jgi:alpha-beta hydrolase superfamily lysophospholipase